MSLSIIAATGKNNELGKDNDLIWHFKEDMKFFRKMTTGHSMVMGRKTFESLPGILPNREHIIISHQALELPKEVKLYHNIYDFLEDYRNEEVFDIGGASMYEALFDYADKLYLTEIEAESKADVYFPKFNKDDFDRDVLATYKEDDIEFKHVLYKRR